VPIIARQLSGLCALLASCGVGSLKALRCAAGMVGAVCVCGMCGMLGCTCSVCEADRERAVVAVVMVCVCVCVCGRLLICELTIL